MYLYTCTLKILLALRKYKKAKSNNLSEYCKALFKFAVNQNSLIKFMIPLKDKVV